MRILVSGAAGFIGSHLVDRLLAEGHSVVAVDSFTEYYNPAFKEENIREQIQHPQYTLYRCDITDESALNAVFTKHSVDWVIHLAAQAGVRASIEQPLLAQKNNVEGTYRVFDIAQRHGVKHVIFASSSSVYGNQEHVPFSETDSVDRPISPYAATKRSCELIAYTYHHLYEMQMIGLRFFTVYGERGRPDMAPYLFTDAILHGAPIQQFGDGSMERDFTYIGDIVDGIVKCLSLTVGYEIINLGHSQPVSVKQFIATIERLTGKKAVIEQRPPRIGDVQRTYADISKAKQLLSWQPTTTLETGLQRTIDWFTTHRI